jgi:hypothetical protein
MIETPAEILCHHATKEAADSFCAWRKRIKKPLTETAAIRIAKTLAAITAAGGDASDALGMAEERGWTGIKTEWYFGQLASTNKPSRTDAATRFVTFAAAAIRTPGADCF